MTTWDDLTAEERAASANVDATDRAEPGFPGWRFLGAYCAELSDEPLDATRRAFDDAKARAFRRLLAGAKATRGNPGA